MPNRLHYAVWDIEILASNFITSSKIHHPPVFQWLQKKTYKSTVICVKRSVHTSLQHSCVIDISVIFHHNSMQHTASPVKINLVGAETFN